MNFVPNLFIGVGATSAYFTLRETCAEHDRDGTFHVRSFHHCNLSQDPLAAHTKAVEAGNQMGMEMTSTVDGIQQEMREIKRATAEQIAEREAAEQRQQEKWAAQSAEREQVMRSQIDQGEYPFGPYASKKFIEAPRGYANWLMTADFEDGSVICYLADALKREHPELALPVAAPDTHVGEIKERRQFAVTCVRQYQYFGDYGAVHITTLVDEDANCLIVFSGAWTLAVGEEATIKATVVEHSEYKGQAQTKINRVKELS